MKKAVRILILEDRPADMKNLERALRQVRVECRLRLVETQEGFIQELERDPPDLVLSEQRLRSLDGLTALAIARQRRPDIPFIFVTNPAGEEKVIASFQGGAMDYILKSHLSQLAPAIERALEKAGERAALQEQQRAFRDTEELRRSQARLASILETALDAIVAVDRQGRIQEWNAAAQRIFGYSRVEVLGRPMDELIVPASLRRIYEGGLIDYVMTGVGSLLNRPIELTLRRADGAEFRAEAAVTLVRPEDPSGCTVLIRDITERKQAEAALRRSEERLRRMIEEVKDYAIYLLDPDGRVATWNSGAEQIQGYKAEEIVGKPYSCFFTPEDIRRGVPDQALHVARERGRSVSEGWRVRKDGTRLWVHGTTTALRDESGQIYGFSKVAHDITAEKEAKDEIRRLNEQLEQRVRERTAQLEAANQELEAFSYSVSHDLRAPLRHIASYVEILNSEAARLDEGSKQHLRVIANSAQHMGRLIDALLAFSRMGRAEMRQQRVSLARVIQEARNELRQEAPGRNIEWKIGPLPNVRADPFMLRQVFINLLSNALKFSRNRPVAKIEIGVEDQKQATVCFVRDNGVGFDMQYSGKLFGVFERLHGAGEFEGTGIGLANVRRIIHRHGGQTWAEGSVDGGATFYFSLPKPTKATV